MNGAYETNYNIAIPKNGASKPYCCKLYKFEA